MEIHKFSTRKREEPQWNVLIMILHKFIKFFRKGCWRFRLFPIGLSKMKNMETRSVVLKIANEYRHCLIE